MTAVTDLIPDEIGFGGLKILQEADGFRYGTDAVLLADMAAGLMPDGAERVMDLGTGNGIIPLILSHKTRCSRIYGLEVRETACRLAEENVRMNGLEGRLKIIEGNVTDVAAGKFGEVGAGAGSMDAVTTNPPYVAAGSGLMSGNEARDIGRHEIMGTLGDFMAAAAYLLRDQGSLFMVNRPGRLVDICCTARECRLEPRNMRYITGKPGEAPNILLIHFIKNGGKNLTVLPQMAVRNPDGTFTEEMLRAYND